MGQVPKILLRCAASPPANLSVLDLERWVTTKNFENGRIWEKSRKC